MSELNALQQVLDTVSQAEKAVYEAQANYNPEKFQNAQNKLKLAQQKIHDATANTQISTNRDKHTLLEAKELLHHLEQTQQSLQ